MARMSSNSRCSMELLDGADLIEETVLEQLTRDTSVQAMPVMIGVFLQESRSRMAHIVSARSAGDLDAVRDEAHALKSTAGTFGALRLQQLAGLIEQACHDKCDEEAKRSVDAMPGVVERTAGQLQAYCMRLRNGVG